MGQKPVISLHKCTRLLQLRKEHCRCSVQITQDKVSWRKTQTTGKQTALAAMNAKRLSWLSCCNYSATASYIISGIFPRKRSVDRCDRDQPAITTRGSARTTGRTRRDIRTSKRIVHMLAYISSVFHLQDFEV